MSNKLLYLGVVLLGVSFCSGIVETNKKRDDLKEIIQKRDVSRYQSLKEKIASTSGMSDSYSVWLKEYNAMQDSIKLDSIAQKAYWEGANMVRDSIKNAAKKR